MVGRAVNSCCAITVYTPESEYWAAGLRLLLLLLFPWLPTSAPPEFPKQRAGEREEKKKRERERWGREKCKQNINKKGEDVKGQSTINVICEMFIGPTFCEQYDIVGCFS